jgi:hypothetical protein
MPSKKELEKENKKESERIKKEQERVENESWQVGTNERAKRKENDVNKKQEEKMKKHREMKELLQQEEDMQINSKLRMKPRKTKNDLFSLLDETLSKLPKTKQQKEKEEKNKKNEISKQRQLFEQEIKNQKQNEEIVKKAELLASNIVADDSFDRKPICEGISGIDNILDEFNDNQNGTANLKVLYNKFYNENIDTIKQENPGLRLTQYNERIQKMWKNSPNNPYGKNYK